MRLPAINIAEALYLKKASANHLVEMSDGNSITISLPFVASSHALLTKDAFLEKGGLQ